MSFKNKTHNTFLFKCNYIGVTQYSESKNLKTCLNDDTFFLALTVPSVLTESTDVTEHSFMLQKHAQSSASCLPPVAKQINGSRHNMNPLCFHNNLRYGPRQTMMPKEEGNQRRRKSIRGGMGLGRVARTRGRPAGVTGHDNSQSCSDWTWHTSPHLPVCGECGLRADTHTQTDTDGPGWTAEGRRCSSLAAHSGTERAVGASHLGYPQLHVLAILLNLMVSTSSSLPADPRWPHRSKPVAGWWGDTLHV